MQLVDTTLREGQQHSGIAFTARQALLLARALDRFGVDFIEVGHPVISGHDWDTAWALCRSGLQAVTLAHARALPRDVHAAKEVGAAWVGIFASINEASLRHKLACSRESALQRVRAAVAEAKRLGLGVRLTCEDASRTPLELVETLFDVAREAGADRLSFADTVGVLTPERTDAAMRTLVRRYGPVMHLHAHNDHGLATANALAAAQAGAAAVDVSIEGIGERCGIAPLAEVACAWTQLYRQPKPWRLSCLPRLSRLLAGCLESAPDLRPVVGAAAFTHKAGLHVTAVLKHPELYEPFPPETVGRRRTIEPSRMLGRKARRVLEPQAESSGELPADSCGSKPCRGSSVRSSAEGEERLGKLRSDG